MRQEVVRTGGEERGRAEEGEKALPSGVCDNMPFPQVFARHSSGMRLQHSTRKRQWRLSEYKWEGTFEKTFKLIGLKGFGENKKNK